MTPLHRTARIERLADRSGSYGMPGVQVDGMDVNAVKAVVGAAVERARSGGGPTLVEALTYRFCGHMPGDTEPYRSREEVDRWRARDPISGQRDAMLRAGIGEAEIREQEVAVATALDAAEAAAMAAPVPDVADIGLGATEWMEWER
jgi:pyruvate dehydrogenase E1 component alpha subunit